MKMSGRTVSDLRQTGLSGRLSRQLTADFPDITNFVFDGVLSDALRKSLSQAQHHCISVGKVRQASPYLWNQLPSSFRQPHSVHCPPGSPHPAHITSSQSSPSFSPSITSSAFHSKLKTHLFHKSKWVARNRQTDGQSATLKVTP